MTSRAALATQSPGAGDRTLAVIAGASVALSVAAVLARFAGMLPDGLATIIAVVGAGIGLNVAMSYTARSASSGARARVMNLMSTAALAISGLAVLASLPRITRAAGLHPFTMDLGAQLWTLALLMLVAGPVRTIGWRALVGAGLTGLLAITALARLVGTPLVERLGTSSILATAVWVPVTEELLKLLPVALVLRMAMRRTTARPSVLDLTLLGAWTGAGFSLFENATSGRGLFSLSANPLLSLLFPSEGKGVASGWTVAQSGHMVHTALIVLGVSLPLMYRRQLSRAWITPIAAIAAVLVEHCSQNAMITGHLNGIVTKIAIVLTLGGRLTSLMLIGGVAYVVALEWRVVGGAFAPTTWFPLRPAEAQRRSRLLAAAQATGRVAMSHQRAGGAA
jgi:RsiW-degrading membrane proteinase PrsW (M82 family)